MTSFQRDTLIYIPEPENDFDKLNHAYWYGGAPLTLKTLNYNFDLDITRYVAFNFDAIEHIIDMIDGIELDESKLYGALRIARCMFTLC